MTESIFCVEVTGNLEIDHGVRDLCRQPYPGNPEGCPNYGKRKDCPPYAPLIEDFIDLSQPHYILQKRYSSLYVNEGRYSTRNLT